MTTQVAHIPDPDMSDWPGSPLSTMHHLGTAAQSIKIEQYSDGPSYVIRFEIPGVPPADLEVSVQTGVLSVRAQRRDQTTVKHGSEFRYGTFARHVALPLGANVQDITATCHNGILTVRIGLEPKHAATAQIVPVETQ